MADEIKKDVSLVPSGMADRKQWVAWKYVQKDEKGKPDKMPYTMQGKMSGWQNISSLTHGNYEEAVKFKSKGGYDGIGFVFTKDDPFVFIDLDNCFEGGKPNELAQKVLELAGNTYSEVSPSGKGLHIFGIGTLEKALKPSHGKFEVYPHGRFSTVTEEEVENEGLLGDIQPAIDYLQGLDNEQKKTTSSGTNNLAIVEGSRNNSLYKEMCRFYMCEARIEEDFTEELKQRGLSYALKFVKDKMPSPIEVTEIHDANDNAFTYSKRDFDSTKKKSFYPPVGFDGKEIQECMTEVFLVDEIVLPELQGQVKYLEDTGEWAVFDTSEQKDGYHKNQWRINVPSKVKHMVATVLKDKPLERLKANYPTVFTPDSSGDSGASKFAAFVKRWGYGYQQNKGITQVMSLFQCNQQISARSSEFDTRKVGHYFPVNNGVIDLKTGELFDITPEMMITRRAGVHDGYDGINYIPTAACQKWELFIDQITCGDRELAKFLQRLLGYVMSAGNPERKLFTGYGVGRNGKSTILNVAANILGKASDGGFFRQIPITTFTKKQYESNGEELTYAVKARLAVASESSECRSFDEGIIKAITGNEEVTYRKMRVGTLNDTPDFTIIICTNHPLKFSGTDQAMVDRVMQIPFNYRVPEGQQNKNLTNELLEEREGILAWMVQGAIDYAKHGLGTCEAVEAATKAYIRENNSVALFLEDCIRVLPPASIGIRIQVKDMYSKYEEHCNEQGGRLLSIKSFAAELKKLNFNTQLSGGKTYWTGVEFIKPDRESENSQVGFTPELDRESKNSPGGFIELDRESKNSSDKWYDQEEPPF